MFCTQCRDRPLFEILDEIFSGKSSDFYKVFSLKVPFLSAWKGIGIYEVQHAGKVLGLLVQINGLNSNHVFLGLRFLRDG